MAMKEITCFIPMAITLILVFSNLPEACGQPDTLECTDCLIHTVPVGKNVVIWTQVPTSEILFILSQSSLMFEFHNGNVLQKCPKCVYENSSAILRDIQLNESGIYIIKVGFTRCICINLTVTMSPTSQASSQAPTFGSRATPDQKALPGGNMTINGHKMHNWETLFIFRTVLCFCIVLVLVFLIIQCECRQ